MNKTLSIIQWHKLASENNAPPVRIQLDGGSMQPLIRRGIDHITIIPINDGPVVGDIILFSVPELGKYVVHRVWAVKESQIMTWGDNCSKPDGWIPREAAWGKVILIERGKRKIYPDPIKGLRWAKYWHQAGKVYRLCKRCKEGIFHRIKKARGFR